MILPLPRTGPSSRCRLQLMTKIRLSSCSREASVIAPSVSGSSHSPSPRNAQTCLLRRVDDAAVGEVAIEPRLVDRHDRAEAHRDGGKFPEARASARDADTTTARRLRCSSRRKLIRFCLGQPAFEKRPGVHAGRGVALEINLVAVVAALAAAAEEVVEADFVQLGRRGERRNVPADAGVSRGWRA